MRALLPWMVLVSGCGLAAPPAGELTGTALVARARFEARVRSTDLLPIDVYFPANADGSARGQDRSALVLIQGGLVDASQYDWLAERLAQSGFVVALPHHESRLAILSLDDGLFARALLVEPPEGSLLEGLVAPERIAVGGHSLGGVVATKLSLRPGLFGAVALLASLPDPADAAALPSLGIPSLSLAGEADCSAALAELRDGWALLPSPSLLAVVEDATHYQFTRSDAPDVERGCAPTVPLEDSHRRISAVLAGFLTAALSDGSVGEAAIRAVDGVEVQVR